MKSCIMLRRNDNIPYQNTDGLVQEKRSSSALASNGITSFLH